MFFKSCEPLSAFLIILLYFHGPKNTLLYEYLNMQYVKWKNRESHKRRLLCSLLHPKTKHLNRVIRDIWSSPALEADSSQLTQGGSKVRRTCQSTIVEAVCAELHHSDRTLRTAWFEEGDYKIEKKNTGWIFIIIGWMCRQISNAHLCSNNM